MSFFTVTCTFDLLLRSTPKIFPLMYCLWSQMLHLHGSNARMEDAHAPFPLLNLQEMVPKGYIIAQLNSTTREVRLYIFILCGATC